MYIILNNTRYNDIRYTHSNVQIVYTGDSLTGIESVSGKIGVYANDGFMLREDDVSDYARQIIRDGAITLTNLPEDYKPPKTLAERVNELEGAEGITFRVLTDTGDIDEETAAGYPDMFLPWEEDTEYTVGNLRSYDGILYKCIQAHTSQASWTPDVATSLWAQAGNPTEEWPEWIQPLGSQDAYRLGSKVSHNAKHWISEIDFNTYEPGVYGWSEAE